MHNLARNTGDAELGVEAADHTHTARNATKDISLG